jgi:hypothetical protein
VKDIPGYEGRYAVTKNGKVWSHPKLMGKSITKGRFLHPISDVGGYLVVHLADGKGRHKQYKVHRLVALVYIPNPTALREVNHRDGIKHNNHVTNLEWSTRSANVKHSYDLRLHLPTHLYGARNGMNTVTEKDVLQIRLKAFRGTTVTQLMREYPISRSQFHMILTGKSWPHLPILPYDRTVRKWTRKLAA